MKKVINFAKEFSPSIIALALPALAFAQTLAQPTAPTPANVPQGQITSIQAVLQLMCTVFAWAFYFLIVIAVIFVIVAAFKYLTAAGDPEKVKSAGSTLLYAAIAIGVALLARAVPLVVGSFLGASGVSSC
jgi:membrane-associated phospholipid phosphatase